MSLHVYWASHLQGEEKKKFEELVIHNTTLLRRLTDIISRKIDTANKKNLSKQGYEDSTWAFKQADHVGYVRALNEILQLTNIKLEG